MRYTPQSIIEHFARSARQICLTPDGRIYVTPAGACTSEEAEVLHQLNDGLVRHLSAPPPAKRQHKEQRNADQPRTESDIQGHA